jgi:hypothetical protein
MPAFLFYVLFFYLLMGEKCAKMIVVLIILMVNGTTVNYLPIRTAIRGSNI